LKNVLWLASWYPNRLDKFDGDFIQRHARAVSLYCKVHVIYVKKDEKLKVNTTETENQISGNLTEQIIYYNSAKTGIQIFDKFISLRSYKKHFRNAVISYINHSGKADLVHVHVAMKAGIAALWIKQKWDIPYIVSEHWTAYLEEADQKIKHFPFLYRKLLNRVLEKASALTVVSDHLGRSINGQFKYTVIPNVVDTAVFFPKLKEASEIVRFIHISGMNYQKNTEAILEALGLMKNKLSFEMYLFGPVNPSLESLINEKGLKNHVFAKGEVSQEILSKELQLSDALILYSRFETFGCVLIEANACGVPVIVSDLEVFHEIIQEGMNGVFVDGENPVALAGKLEHFILQKFTFDKIAIAESTAEKYNYKKVGQQFLDMYKTLITKKETNE
jgi:glycosyltransferase involved in cell wall biosynthesis